MSPVSPLLRLRDHVHARVRDRARAGTFLRFLWKRFLDDRLFEAAGALSYTTAFALVPLSMVVFGVLSAFPGFQDLTDRLATYIFSNFVPSAAVEVKNFLIPSAAVAPDGGTAALTVWNAKNITAAGVFALIVSLLITLTSVEAVFNRIWRVQTARPKFSRFLVYWTVLTLGALVAATSLALSSRFFALSIFETRAGRWLEMLMLWATPLLIELFAFATIFRVVPHRTIKWRHAFAGALLAVALFELIKWALGFYFGHSQAYKNIYGALALAPMFLLWIFLGWVAILFGASFAASLSAFRYQPAALRLPHGYEIYGMLRMLGRFQQARLRGTGLHSDEIQQLEPILTDSLVQEMLAELCKVGVVKRAEGGEWLLARDLDDVTIGELYEAGQLRVPVAEAVLPNRDDALGQAVLAVIDQLRLPMRDQLKQRVASIYDAVAGEDAPA